MTTEDLSAQPLKPQEKVAITKEQVIESLRARPDDFSLMTEFLNQREAQFSREPADLDYLLLGITQAEMYRDAGLREEAREAFESSLIIADQSAEKLGRPDLVGYCEAELAKLSE